MYTSQTAHFKTYNGQAGTPYVGDNGNWWVNGKDTGQPAQGADGTSFGGVQEFYYATLANDSDKPSWNNGIGWSTNVIDTLFGSPNEEGVIYKYLWNVEVVKSTSSNGDKLEPTDVNLLSIYEGGRIPINYISYYAGSTTSTVPKDEPYLDSDGNNIIEKENSAWKEQSNFTGSADANTYLFEITFVEYQTTDELGKNKYIKTGSPILIGRNGEDGLNLVLDNDYDVVIKDANGSFGSMPIIKAQVMRGGSVDNIATNAIKLTPPNDKFGYTFKNGILTIEEIPSDFVQGSFQFEYNDLIKLFNLTIQASNFDYNLEVAQTTINNTNQNGSFQVKIRKTSLNGEDTILDDPNDDKNIKLYIDNGNTAETSWLVRYAKGSGQGPITLTIKDANGFIWDEEIIEFVQNGDVGNGISKVTEYYQATKTNTPPGRYKQDGISITDNWKTSPSEAGQSNTTPYLWNFERTEYSGDLPIKDTDVVLISSEPRSISAITEYYCSISDGTTPTTPYFKEGDGDHNEMPVVPEVWAEGIPKNILQGSVLWNCEVIQYTSTDANGKNLYSIVPAAQIGYTGKDGTGVSINGTAYVSKDAEINDNSINKLYDLYDAEGNKITNAEKGDSYIVQGYLFVYSPNNSQFVCTGKIQGEKGGEGRGISSIINYYLASSRATGVIAGKDEGDEKWDAVIPTINESKPYLWNYEETIYNDGSQTWTDASLIGNYSKDGRGIEKIEEFYCVNNDNTCSKPTDNTLDASSTPPADLANIAENEWYNQPPITSITYPNLWNCERVTYSTKETVIFEPALVGQRGQDGHSPYTMSLDNDFDVAVKTSDGVWLTDKIEVNVTCYEGNSISNKGAISVTPNPSDLEYTFNNNKLTIDTESNPNLSPGDITITWKDTQTNTVYAQKTFSYSVITSLVDYNLLIKQTTYNSSLSGGDIVIEVQKKTAEGTVNLSKPGTNDNIQIYKNGTLLEPTDDKGWLDSYLKNQTAQIVYELKSTTDEAIIWDKETIEFTQNGSGIKRLYLSSSEPTSQTFEEWAAYAIDQVPIFISTQNMSTNNSTIKVEDTVYITGIVTDHYSSVDVNQSITLYGTVKSKAIIGDTNNTEYAVLITSIVYGGEKGEIGSSAYTISLDNDFCSVPATSKGNIDDNWSIVISPTLYHGESPEDWSFVTKGSSSEGIYIETENITAATNNTTKTVTVSKLTNNNGYVRFIYQNANKKLAERTFEAVKQLAGSPGSSGDPGEYIYTLIEPGIIYKEDITPLKASSYKKVGTKEAETISAYYKYTIDNDANKTGELLVNNNGELYPATEDGTIDTTSWLKSIEKFIVIYSYSDEDRTKLFDKETIEAIFEPKQDFYLYHDGDGANRTRPNKPENKDYSSFSDTNAEGWYKIQTDSSKYYVFKGQATTLTKQKELDWLGPHAIDSEPPTYAELWQALEQESQNDKDNIQNGIYPITADDGSCFLGINASLIKTGALCVGNTPVFKTDGTVENWNNNILYAALTAPITNNNPDAKPIVGLAGWQVTENSITTGTFGSSDSFHMYSAGTGIIAETKFGASGKNWMLGIGSNFGVTKDGSLYCTNGSFTGTINADNGIIGGWNITDGTGYNSGIYKDVVEGGVKKYRFGMKTEDGDSERFAWYVKGFQGIEADGEQPKGTSIFGVRFNGEILATAGKIGGWNLTDNSLDTDKMGTGFHMRTSDLTTGVNFAGRGSAAKDWRLGIGSNFGVTSNGSLYCSNIQATGGKIAGWDIKKTSLSYTPENKNVPSMGFSHSGEIHGLDNDKLGCYYISSSKDSEMSRILITLDLAGGSGERTYDTVLDSIYDGLIEYTYMDENDRYYSGVESVTFNNNKTTTVLGGKTFTISLTNQQLSIDHGLGATTGTLNLSLRGLTKRTSYISTKGTFCSNEFQLRSGSVQIIPYYIGSYGFLIHRPEASTTGQAVFISNKGIEYYNITYSNGKIIKADKIN